MIRGEGVEHIAGGILIAVFSVWKSDPLDLENPSPYHALSSHPLSGEEITPIGPDGQPVGKSYLITRAEGDSNESVQFKHVH